MAHEIEFVDGVPSIVYVGATPWHGLGERVDPDTTPIEMMQKANLDWRVVKEPCFFERNDKMVMAGVSALVRDRDDKIMDVVPDEWEPCQNEQAFEFFTKYCESGMMQMHTAGSLRGGQRVWALAKMRDGFELFGGDNVEGYLLFSNPHKFGAAIDVRFTPIRVVCNNTLTLSLNTNAMETTEGSGLFRQSHRTVFDAARAAEQLGLASEKLAEYREMAEFLGSKRYNTETLTEYFGNVFPLVRPNKDADSRKELSKNATIALGIVDQQPGAEYAPGSWWQAFNTVTFMTDHVIGRNQDRRLEEAWFGQVRGRKIRALEKAVEYAQAA